MVQNTPGAFGHGRYVLSFATTDGFCKGQVQLFISRSCMHLGLIGVGSLDLFHVLALVFCMFFAANTEAS